ncbi:MAG: hypothetical protein ACRD1Q_07490, partial [Vicinamibacterales bacterium]
MMNRQKRSHRIVATLAGLSLFAQTSALTLTAVPLQTQTGTKQADPAKAPPKGAAPTGAKPSQTTVATAVTAPIDGGWPRTYDLPTGGNILLYQPQIASWERQKNLVGFSAVSYRAKAGDKTAIGTIKLEAATDVSLEERLVNLKNLKIVEANFQTLQKEQVREVAAVIDKVIPDEDRVIALDRVLANLDKSQIVPKNVEGIKADPPAIFFSKTSAVIVNLDGEPICSPIMGNDLTYAVNTNWDL